MIYLCFFLALPTLVLITISTSIKPLQGSNNVFLSAEHWLEEHSSTTSEERSWQREKLRRQMIRERLQQESVSLSSFSTNASRTINATILPSLSANHSSKSALAFGKPPILSRSGKFNWHQPAIQTQYTLVDPQLYENETMTIIVLSARGNFERRAVIRETWGRNHALYFVIGGRSALVEDASVQDQLLAEQDTHKDLLDSLHPDVYASLPYKLRFAYQWVITRLPKVEWIVKVDDDTVVRVDTLQNAFLRSFNPTIPVVVGKIIEKSVVARSGKWKELDYPNRHYPFWPQGSCGHVVSRVVAQYVASMPANSFVYYQGEDVSLGIWLDEAPPDRLEPVTWIHSNYFSNDRKCLNHAWLIMGHEITPDEMRACFRAKDEWPVAEVTHKHWNYWTVDTLKRKRDAMKRL